jgi:fructose-bisphosphate aldolase, class II
MPLVPLRKVLDHAAANGYGVAAFNVNNMEQIQAIMEAAKETDSPVIIQASRGARSYSQDNYLKHLMLAAAELYPQIPVVMHQDHGNSPSTCASAIANNFTSVMMDGSLKEDGKTPADYDYNVRVTAEVVKLAHPKNVSVEGELGCLGSLEHGEGEQEDGHGAVGKLSRDRTRLRILCEKRASMPWLSPSAPATAPINSPASRTAKSWQWIGSSPSTKSCRIATS